MVHPRFHRSATEDCTWAVQSPAPGCTRLYYRLTYPVSWRNASAHQSWSCTPSVRYLPMLQTSRPSCFHLCLGHKFSPQVWISHCFSQAQSHGAFSSVCSLHYVFRIVLYFGVRLTWLIELLWLHSRSSLFALLLLPSYFFEQVQCLQNRRGIRQFQPSVFILSL